MVSLYGKERTKRLGYNKGEDMDEITIAVEVGMNGKLIQPIIIENMVIDSLGVFNVNGLTVWIVRKQPKRIELPNNVLPRHANDRDNIKDICIAINQIAGYLRQKESGKDDKR